MKDVVIGKICIGTSHPLCVISGPCVIESRDLALKSAEWLKKTLDAVGLPLIYKSSFDKANRSAIQSFRGVGLEEGLKILEEVKQTFAIPVTSDIHLPEQAGPAAEVLDLLQIPAFLCRQTDLLLAAAAVGKPLNIKKGQFLAPWDMKQVVDKVVSRGNDAILLTDRGTSFGYNNLITDIRAIPLMQSLGYPVCFDASHSAQLPGGLGYKSGGQREFIPPLTYAAIAAGANALFIESHPNPDAALSDAATVYPFDALHLLLAKAKRLYEVVHT